MQKLKKIKIPILVPLTIAILVLLSASVLCIYFVQRKNNIDRVKTKIEAAQTLFNKSLSVDSRMMDGMLDFLKQDTNLQSAFILKDRKKLLAHAEPIFKDIRQKYKITHFYFIEPDKTCFLRAHNPTKYNDTITRFTVDDAVEQQKCTWGIELGKYGSFTLRVVHPWIVDDKLIGYLQLGEEIEHILPTLKNILGVEFFAVIDKQYINRKKWEQGRQIFEHNADWDYMPQQVVIDTSLKNLSTEQLNVLKPILSHRQNSSIAISLANHSYMGGFVRLIDAGNRDVGSIAIMRDTTKLQATLKLLILGITLISVSIGSGLLVVFYFHIRRIESNLTTVYAELYDEVERRKVVENQLQDAYGHMESEVQQRTAELRNEIAEREKTENILYKLNRELEMTVECLTEANREMEQFAFITSHHLKEPVRKISTFGRLLTKSLSDKLNADEKENLDFMIEGANKIEKMVSSLKFYLESSSATDEQKQVDLNSIVQKIIESKKIKKLKFTNNFEIIAENLPTVYASENQLQQLFALIISNSIHYRKSDKLLKINICARERDEEKFLIEIKDNGVGISKEYIREVFKPFKRLNPDLNKEAVGIGLTICRNIIERLDCEIGINSIYGQGTTVWFTLPRAKKSVQRLAFKKICV